MIQIDPSVVSYSLVLTRSSVQRHPNRFALYVLVLSSIPTPISFYLMDASHPDEGTPLLGDSARTGGTRKVPNRLPKLQIAIVLLLQICEPITSQSIYPYINEVRNRKTCFLCPLKLHFQLISGLDITGGDERKVGYYAGLIVGTLNMIATDGPYPVFINRNLFSLPQKD